jgi:hypothetical protein
VVHGYQHTPIAVPQILMGAFSVKTLVLTGRSFIGILIWYFLTFCLFGFCFCCFCFAERRAHQRLLLHLFREKLLDDLGLCSQPASGAELDDLGPLL